MKEHDINRKLRLWDDQYYTEEVEKTQIYLHHTVGGSARSTIGWWNTSNIHVGTSYLVDRDGSIYEVFAPEYWAYHLGLRTNFNKASNMKSIGIELCSEGALRDGGALNQILVNSGDSARMREDILYAFDIFPNSNLKSSKWFRKAKPLYHLLDDKSLFSKVDKEWRGFTYFDAYDEAQMDGLFWLLQYLCDKFNIPRKFLSGDMSRFDISLAVDFKGILSHANVRADKTDVHQKFDWINTQRALGVYDNLSDVDISAKPLDIGG
jgi:N-acetyl-anhydromuramyl-L-alanine amidase AmpD